MTVERDDDAIKRHSDPVSTRLHDAGRPPVGSASVGELVTALALFLVGAAGVWLSVDLERPARWYTAPGLVPLLLSASLALMAFILAAGAVWRGALAPYALRQMAKRPAQTLRYLAAVGGIAFFYFVLLRYLPFEAACALYLFYMFRVFWLDATWIRQAVAASLASVGFVVAFQLVFDIPLPGDTIFEQLVFRFR